MAAIDNIINIVISQSTTAVPTTSTKVPLIVGNSHPDWADGDFVHTYSDAASLLTDGFAPTDIEYVAALALTSQKIVPNTFLVGRRQPSDANGQAAKVSIDYSAQATSYGLNIDGYGFFVNGSGSQASVAAALAAAINTANVSGLSAAVTSDSDVQLTAIAPTALTTTQLANVTVDAGSGSGSGSVAITSSLAAITAQNNTWYGLVAPMATDDEIAAIAHWVESQRKVYIATSATAAIGDATSTSDVGAALQTASYDRTALLFSPASAQAGIDAGWAGGFLPDTPGSYNTAYMTIAGIPADTLSAGQQAACIGNPVGGTQGKNVNIYQRILNIGVTQEGTAASGQYLDLTIGVDALYFAIQTEVFSTLINNKKIPFTNKGVSMLVAALRGVIEQFIQQGLIDGTEDYGVSAAKVSSVPKSQRKGRIAPDITFSCVVQGAVNAIRVNGVVEA